MFADRAKIHIKAGDGGKGCVSFRRSRSEKVKTPNGGDGGNGGDVVFKVDPNLKGLLDFRYRQHFKAKSGVGGGSNKKRGRDGAAFVVRIPPGTIVRDLETGYVLRDLIEHGEELVVARGGEGGRGNAGRKVATGGEAGETKDLELELKLIADLGIVGFPNSGKSTLIRKISNAHPKVASYPFTTLAPVLGVLRLEDFKDIVVCEVPGLIEGAHLGKGLGHSFLRHIERTKILVHLVDMAGEKGADPLRSYESLNQELELHDPGLVRKVQILAASKMDLPGAEANLRAFKSRVKGQVYPVSALRGDGIEELISAIRERLL